MKVSTISKDVSRTKKTLANLKYCKFFATSG